MAKITTSRALNSLYVLGDLSDNIPKIKSVAKAVVEATTKDITGRDFHFITIRLGTKRIQTDKIMSGNNKSNTVIMVSRAFVIYVFAKPIHRTAR